MGHKCQYYDFNVLFISYQFKSPWIFLFSCCSGNKQFKPNPYLAPLLGCTTAESGGFKSIDY